MAQPGDSEPSAATSPRRLPGTAPPVPQGGDTAEQVLVAGERGPDGRTLTFLDVPGAPPATRRDGGSWLFIAVLGFVGGEIVAYLLAVMAAALAGESSQLTKIVKLSAPPEWYVGTSLVGLWVGFLAAPWLASRLRGTGRLVPDLGVRFRPIDVLGVLIGVGSQFAVGYAYKPFITNSSKFGAPVTRLTGASHGWGFLVIAVLTVVGAPFFEELFFRGLLFKSLARILAPVVPGPSGRRAVAVVAAVVADGLLFGLAHGEWAQFAGLAAFGMVLAAVSYRTGRLGMNMVAHASFNLVAVIAVLQNRGAIVH
jgi:uncharacterized protein